MQPYFSFSFDGVIWQVLTDDTKAYLVLEIRHANHTVSFSAVDLTQKKLLWNGFSLPEAWWSSGVLVQNGILFLQTFPDGQNPDPRGVTAVDIKTKEILWQHPDIQFVQQVSDSQLLARQFVTALPTYFLIKIDSGEILSKDTVPLWSKGPLASDSGLHFPVHYTSDDVYFQNIADFLGQTLKIDAKNAFDYAQTQHCIIISYYIYANNQVENYLVAFDTHSRVPLLHEKLATQRTGIGKNTFFIFEQYLIFVKEQSVLLSYEL